MQFIGSASTTHNPDVDMPVAKDMIDGGDVWAAAEAAVSTVGDETVAAAPEKEPYVPATGDALGAKMNHDASHFEVDTGSGDSYEDLIASGVNEFLDMFRELDDGPAGGCFPEGGLNAGNQGMEVDDDEFDWLNSPDAFMPLPIGDTGDIGQAPATVAVPTGEEEEAGMGQGVGDDDMEKHVAQAPLAADWAVPEAAPKAAPAAAAAVAATTIVPPVALEGDMAEGTGGESAVTPAPAFDFSGGEGGGEGASDMFAGGPPDGAADAGAAGVGVAAAEAMAVMPTATNMAMVNGAGGDEHDCGLSQKELRRQKVERYLAKKKRRLWSRASSYQSRQRVANNRPRHKGRFLPLVSDFVPMSELKRRQRALMAQQAAEEEERQASFPTLDVPPGGWGASPQFTGVRDYGQGDG